MAVAKAQVDLLARDQVTGVAGKVEAVLLRMKAKMQAVAQSAQRMLMIGGAAVGGLVYAAAKQHEAEQKLESVLRATGHAAGFTSEQLRQMAADLQLVTAQGDETTLAAMAILASFREIKGDMFKAAIEMAMDMSTVMGTDLKGSVLQLGKALNDPREGMTALTRAGVSFTEAQKDQVKALQASGDMLSAQNLVLKELRQEFGGAARDEIKQAGGAIKQIKNEAGDLAEQMGDVLMPTIMDFLASVRNVLTGLTEWAKQNADIILKIGKWAAGIGILLVILPRLIGVLAGLVTILRGVAAATMLVMNLSGPAGWALVATAVTATAAAVALLKHEYDKLMDSISEAREEGKRQSEEAKRQAEERLNAPIAKPLTLPQLKSELATAQNMLQLNRQIFDQWNKQNRLQEIAQETVDQQLAEIDFWLEKEAAIKERVLELTLKQAAAEAAAAEAAAAKVKAHEEDHAKWIQKLEEELELVGKTADEAERMKRAWAGATPDELRQGEIVQDLIREAKEAEAKKKRLNEEAKRALREAGEKQQHVAARFEGLTQAWKRIQSSAARGQEATVQERQAKAAEAAAARLKEGDVKAHDKLDEMVIAIKDKMNKAAIFAR